MPLAHAEAGLARAMAIIPLDVNGQSAEHWLDPASRNYDDIATGLSDRGLSANQVQVIWLKVVNADESTRPSIPDPAADVVLMPTRPGQIVRILDDLYPNLQQVFVSSRTYGGSSEHPKSPHPWTYETGFGMKWLIEAQAWDRSADRISHNWVVCAAPWDINSPVTRTIDPSPLRIINLKCFSSIQIIFIRSP